MEVALRRCASRLPDLALPWYEHADGFAVEKLHATAKADCISPSIDDARRASTLSLGDEVQQK